MTRRTVRVHANCGTRIPGKLQNYCPKCHKWLIGPGSVVRVYRDTGKPTRGQQGV